MDDRQFLQHFEVGTLDPFQHRDHIRMAWLYLRQSTWEGGYAQIQQGIRRFAAHHGATMLYHESITQFWARMVYCTVQATTDIDDFDAFTEANPALFDKTLIREYYSRSLLASPTARSTWIEPDLRPLPDC